MPEGGWISKWAFQENALTADAVGRAAMQDGYTTNDKIALATIQGDRIADSTITLDKLATSFLEAFAVTGRVDETKLGLSLVA